MNNVSSVTASTGAIIGRLFAGILCMVLLQGCEVGTKLTSPSGLPTVTITPSSIVRNVGETQQFTVQVTGGNSSEASASTVEWEGSSVARLTGSHVGSQAVFTCADVGSGGVFAEFRTGVLNTQQIGATATLVCLRPDPPPTVTVNLAGSFTYVFGPPTNSCTNDVSTIEAPVVITVAGDTVTFSKGGLPFAGRRVDASTVEVTFEGPISGLPWIPDGRIRWVQRIAFTDGGNRFTVDGVVTPLDGNCAQRTNRDITHRGQGTRR